MPFLPLVYGHGYETPPPDSVLKGDQTFKMEDIRAYQDLMNWAFAANLRLDGQFGPATVDATKLYLGARTGHPEAKEGRAVVGNQYGDLHLELVRRHSGGGGGLTKEQADLLYQAIGIIPRHGHGYATKGHGHEAEITETTKVTVK